MCSVPLRATRAGPATNSALHPTDAGVVVHTAAGLAGVMGSAAPPLTNTRATGRASSWTRRLATTPCAEAGRVTVTAVGSPVTVDTATARFSRASSMARGVEATRTGV